MKITIQDNSKLCEIQKEFSKHFPYLKLEFFKLEPGKENMFSKRNLITDTNKMVRDIRPMHKPGYITINGHQKVSALEQHFREKFGISVQVFRKSANTWLQTTNTDNLTLVEQNKKGEEMSNSIKQEVIDDYDQYHEQL